MKLNRRNCGYANGQCSAPTGDGGYSVHHNSAGQRNSTDRGQVTGEEDFIPEVPGRLDRPGKGERERERGCE